MAKRYRSMLYVIPAAIAVLLSSGARLNAQLGMATLSGTVTDPSGAGIPGAQVSLESTTEKAKRQTISDTSGAYVIPAVPPGSYQLVVSASGFETRTITGVNLTSGQGSTLNVSLGLSKTEQKVTVEASAPLLQTTTATVGSNVTARQFTDLPMLGRNFTSMINILPGVANVPPPGSYEWSGIQGQAISPSVYGQRQRDNNYTVDGAPAVEPNFNRLGMIPPPEAMAEMKVEAAMDSGAYGWASGANINLVTKSGTNRYHGDVWEYLRNSSLKARSFFVPKAGQFQWNQFGAAAGGPLVIPHLLSKDKAWYVFGYYEGIRLHQASNFTALVPTAAQLGGDFSGVNPIFDPNTSIAGPQGNLTGRQPFPGNRIPSSSLNPLSLTLAKALYPTPNLLAGVIPGVNYVNPAPGTTTSDQWSARVDHQFGAEDSFYARYTDWRNLQIATGLPLLPSTTDQRWTNSVASDTHVFNPAFLVTVRFGLQRVLEAQYAGGPDLSKQTGLVDVFPPYHGFDFLPAMSIQGYPALSQFYGNQGPQYHLSWTGDAQKIKGRHTLAFGAGTIRTSYFADHTAGGENFTNQPTAFGAGSGYSLASYLLGLPSSATRQAGNTGGNYVYHDYSLYVQDTLRASSRWTFILGLRWDYMAPFSQRPGIGTFDWNTGRFYWTRINPITHQPANLPEGVVPPDRHGFQPRLGIAYQLTPKTVVRTSFGIFDNLFTTNQQSNTSARGNWPFAFQQTLAGLNLTTPDAFIQNPFPGPPVGSLIPLGCGQCLNVDASTSRLPYVEEWTFSVQRQVTPSLALEADYMGSHGVKLNGQLMDNTAIVAGVGRYQDRQRWPQFPAYIMNGFNQFMSWYDGLDAKLTKRYSQNLYFMLSYTWSKALDEVDDLATGGPGQPSANPTRFDRRMFKGPAAFDFRHLFRFSYTYDIPWKTRVRPADFFLAGWQLSGIFSADSGAPYFVYLSTDNENIGEYSGRYTEFPNLVGNPNAVQSTPRKWFNTAAFVLPPFGTAGTAGRHALYADGLLNWDTVFAKHWPFKKEGQNVEFRGEFFNFFNAHTFAAPNALLGTPNFGIVSSTRQGGREIQFALKVHF